MPLKENVLTSVPNAPPPNGDYSLVVRSGNTIHIAGFMGDDPATGLIVEGGVEAQTDRAMHNILACLAAAGSGPEKIVRRRMYFVDIKKDLRVVVAVWGRYVKEPWPVSTAVQVGGLAKEGALIEIEVEAEA